MTDTEITSEPNAAPDIDMEKGNNTKDTMTEPKMPPNMKNIMDNYILNSSFPDSHCKIKNREEIVNYITQGIKPEDDVREKSEDLTRCIQTFEMTEHMVKNQLPVLKDVNDDIHRNCPSGFAYRSGSEGYEVMKAACDTKNNLSCTRFKDKGREMMCVTGLTMKMSDGTYEKVPAWKMNLCDMGAEAYQGAPCFTPQGGP